MIHLSGGSIEEVNEYIDHVEGLWHGRIAALAEVWRLRCELRVARPLIRDLKLNVRVLMDTCGDTDSALAALRARIAKLERVREAAQGVIDAFDAHAGENGALDALEEALEVVEEG